MGEAPATPGNGCVLAAVDLDRSTARVLQHAAGFARIFGLPLRVLHATADTSDANKQKVLDHCARVAPYAVDVLPEDLLLRTGMAADAIHGVAIQESARLIVMGSRARGVVASVVFGSTCKAVLASTPTPVLLVPPNDVDIVDVADRARLTCGPVLAAVDLSETNHDQLELAGELAHLAEQPLLLVTVVGRELPNSLYTSMLRTRARRDHLTPRAVIVRHGNVADEIAQCAAAEGAGVVVMGLRARARGRPGAVAAAVLRSSAAFVLAVPAGRDA